jgi:5'-deoxynucleotidase YfbR-like HD superfamily hydrolase
VTCIYIEIFGLPRPEILFYCLHHDSGELYAGDLPYRVKKSNKALQEGMKEAEETGLRILEIKLPQLTDIERLQVKIADLLEMHETGVIECAMGNSFAEPIVTDTLSDAQELASKIGQSDAVNTWLTSGKIK